MMIDRIKSRLTDAYNKRPDSNISKVLRIFTEEVDEIDATYDRIVDWSSVDNARGVPLDILGKDVAQPRGQATDEVYRILIKSKVARDLSTADTDTIITVLSMAIGADPSEIGIQETWANDDDPEPASINLIQVPIRRLNEVGMSGRQFGRIIARTIAAGVGVRSIDLSGTFSYGAIGEAPSETEGFADVDQTFGGFYGTLYQPGDDTDLPI